MENGSQNLGIPRNNAVCVLGHHGDMYRVNVLGYLGHTIELNSILILCSILQPQVHGVSVKWLIVCHMLPLSICLIHVF